MIYVTEGKVYIEEDGVEYSLSQGDALLLYPGVMHTGSRMSEGETKFSGCTLKPIISGASE